MKASCGISTEPNSRVFFPNRVIDSRAVVYLRRSLAISTNLAMHAYQHQHAALTLRQGIAEYYRDSPGLKRGDDLSAEAREFFRCHDAAHVVFGCDTSLPQEAVVKLASMFGTTAGLSVLRGYRLYESRDIYRQLRVVDVLRTIALSVVIVPRTIYRCTRQHARWPWSDFAAHLDRPLSELRAKFGIRVAA
jgi:hypothetical protein